MSGAKVLQRETLVDHSAIKISTKDRLILRKLAEQYVGYLALPKEKEKQELQKRKNQLDWVRPIVICFPEVSWREIVPSSSLTCDGDLARQWENQLRQLIFIAQMDSDQCLTPGFSVGLLHNELNWGISMKQEGDLEHGSYRWQAPIQNPDDLKNLKSPIMRVDFDASALMFEEAKNLFSDILPVIQKESWFWTTGLTQTFIYLRGLQQMMFDMVDYPDFVHALMTHLRDGTLAFLDDLEANDLLFPNWDISYCGSGGIGLTDQLPSSDFTGKVRLMDQWGFCESQETVGVSPRMFNQFIFPYQQTLMEKFGLLYYGCCEPVDQRWRYLQKIPNLRRVSVSPWSDRLKIAEFLGSKYIYCWKPNPAFMAFEYFPEDAIRQDIRETLDAARDCHLEIILKDVTTVRNQPQRINRWVQIVKEEIFRG